MSTFVVDELAEYMFQKAKAHSIDEDLTAALQRPSRLSPVEAQLLEMFERHGFLHHLPNPQVANSPWFLLGTRHGKDTADALKYSDYRRSLSALTEAVPILSIDSYIGVEDLVNGQRYPRSMSQDPLWTKFVDALSDVSYGGRNDLRLVDELRAQDDTGLFPTQLWAQFARGVFAHMQEIHVPGQRIYLMGNTLVPGVAKLCADAQVPYVAMVQRRDAG